MAGAFEADGITMGTMKGHDFSPDGDRSGAVPIRPTVDVRLDGR
jgi:hypothetical protein